MREDDLGVPRLEESLPGLSREFADKKKLLYELTDGPLTGREISKKVGMATGPISETWLRWEQLGLLTKDGKKYRKVL